MTCYTCGQPSLLGRNIYGKSTAGYDYREVNEYGQPVSRGGIIYNGNRPYGTPKTDAERLRTHTAVYGAGSSLPSRGTGRARAMTNGEELPWGSFIFGGVLGIVFGYFIFSQSGRRIGYEAGMKTARRFSR